MAFVNDIRHVENGFVSRIRGYAQTLRARFERHRLYRRTLNELDNLSERELADLGIHRSMLADIAYQAAYGA